MSFRIGQPNGAFNEGGLKVREVTRCLFQRIHVALRHGIAQGHFGGREFLVALEHFGAHSSSRRSLLSHGRIQHLRDPCLVRVPLDGQGALDRIRLCGQAAGYVSALPAQLSNLGAQAQQFSPLGVAEDVIRSNGRSRGGLRTASICRRSCAFCDWTRFIAARCKTTTAIMPVATARRAMFFAPIIQQ